MLPVRYSCESLTSTITKYRHRHFVCNVDYCDFVIWTEEGLYHDQMEPDHTLWDEICERATGFFKHAVLPELVGKYFSKIQPATSAAAQGPSMPANEHQRESDTVESSKEKCMLNYYIVILQ